MLCQYLFNYTGLHINIPVDWGPVYRSKSVNVCSTDPELLSVEGYKIKSYLVLKEFYLIINRGLNCNFFFFAMTL